MPTYEYQCTACSHVFDAFQSMKDAPLTECPQCGKLIKRRIYGGTGIIFKGSGFYINDSATSSAASSAGAASSADATGSKSATSSAGAGTNGSSPN